MGLIFTIFALFAIIIFITFCVQRVKRKTTYISTKYKERHVFSDYY